MKTCSICGGNSFSEYCQKAGFILLRCDKCGLIFVDNLNLDLKAFYSNPNYLHDQDGRGYVNYEMDKAPMSGAYLNILNKIKSWSPVDSLLDVGTANGYFLDVANANGYKAEGIEINSVSVQEGRRLGRKIREEDLLTADYAKESFGAVTAFDFFEHIPSNQAKNYLEVIRNILARNGVLVIITVNTSSLWARIFGTHWHTFLPPEHISFYSDRNIKILLEQCGFKVLEIKTLHKSFSLQYIFNFIYRVHRFWIWHSIASFLGRHPFFGRIALKLYLGDNMIVFAQKV